MKRTLTTLLCLLVALTLSSCVTINVPTKETPTPEPTKTPEPTLNPYAAIDANSIAAECDKIIDSIDMDGFHFLSGTTYTVSLFMPENSYSIFEAYLSPTSVDEETYAQAKDTIKSLVESFDELGQAIQQAFDEADHSEVSVYIALFVDDSYEQPVLFWFDRSLKYSMVD